MNVTSSPAYSVAYVHLEVGESVLSERGAMVAMSAGISVSGAVDGGIARASLRKMFANESFLFARFTGEVHGAWVALAPRFPGDIASVDVSHGAPLSVQQGSLLGYEDTVDASVKVGTFGQVVLREGATALHCTGEGKVLVASDGGLERFEVGTGQKMIVDTGHLAAWSSGMDLRVGMLGSAVTAAATGEGLVGEMTGPGVVYVQTRAEQQLRSWLFPERSHDRT